MHHRVVAALEILRVLNVHTFIPKSVERIPIKIDMGRVWVTL
jgi:hypothetical protein